MMRQIKKQAPVFVSILFLFVIALGIVTSSVVTGGHSLYSFCSR